MDLRKLTATISWAMVMTIGLAACGGGSSGSSTPPPAPPVAEPPPDTDGDGVADDDDAFPDDPNEETDTDGDGVGDNSDNCVENENPGQEDSDANGEGDVCDPMPLVYSAKGYAGEGTEDGVSYTGQTARQVLQLQLVGYMEDLQESPGQFQEVSDGLRFYVTGEGADETPHGFTVKGGTATGEEVIPGPTYGDISTGKNLNGKIAGGSLAGTGETEKLIDGEFFGPDSIFVGETIFNGLSRFNITAIISDTGQKMGLFFPTDIEIGTYEMTTNLIDGSEKFCQYTPEIGETITYISNPGTLTISDYDQDAGFVEGTFTFTALDLTAQDPEVYQITEGEFTIEF